MSASDLLKNARSTGYGESKGTTTGSINRSFNLDEPELRGLGRGPYSLRVDGEHDGNGSFKIHRVARIEEGESPEDKAVDVRSTSQVSPS
jgi:hypothetical protein